MSIDLNDFEKFIQQNWPYANPPYRMKQFCIWFELIIDNLDISSTEKKLFKSKSIETWLNINMS